MEYGIKEILKEVVMMYKVANENAVAGLTKATTLAILHLHKILGEYPNKDERILFNGGMAYPFEEARRMLLNEEELRTKFPVNAFGRWAELKLAKLENQTSL